MIKISRLNESKSDEVISSFEEADKNGSVSVNLDYLGKDWYKNTKDYHLYDNFYLYNNSIFKLNTFPSGTPVAYLNIKSHLTFSKTKFLKKFKN